MHPLLRFTLDLFDPPAPPPEPRPASSGVMVEPPDTQRKKLKTRTPKAQRAPELVANQELLGVNAGMPGLAEYRHPEANREIVLGSAVVGFAFRRGRRRTIGFTVSAQGLVVSAPKWVPLHEVDAAVREKSSWITAKLVAAREREARLAQARVEWCDGTTIPFLGQPVIVVLDPRHAFDGVGAVLHTDAGDPNPGLAGVPSMTLHVALPHAATPEQIRDAVQAWLMRQAKRVFAERLDHFAAPLQVRWRRLSLSSAGTRWGSASADGSIRLNWRLIHFRQEVIDYVVAHELSHLRVMDHSPRFWDTVRSVVPGYAELRGQLKDETLPHWG